MRAHAPPPRQSEGISHGLDSREARRLRRGRSRARFREPASFPSVAHSHLLGGLPLADASFLGSSEPVQLIPFLLAHRDSFHPLALRLSRGTFFCWSFPRFLSPPSQG